MSTNINQAIEDRINKYQPREPILFEELSTGFENHKKAVYTAISRLHKKSIIETYEKGIYYRPKKTKFGNLKIDKELLIKKKYIGIEKQLGYMTGPEIWNKFNLTTQISKRKWIAQPISRKKEIDNLNIVIVKAKTEVKNANIHILQFLDILDQIDYIPDTSETDVILNLKEHYMNNFTVEERVHIFNYAEKYTHKVKILLGFIASHIKNEYFNILLNNYYQKTKTRNKVKSNIDLSKFEIKNEWSALLEITRK